jgi:glycosyltransferase involved in cell wall biosynthesis
MIPKVSVLIPVYNTADYLRETVESIINQSLKEIEIIIINDGSNDNSLDIIKEYALKDSRIKFESKQNSGLSDTRNHAKRVAKGEYVYFMDSDDILQREALEKCYDFAISNNLDLVLFDASIFGFDSEKLNPGLSYDRSEHLHKEKIYSGIEAISALLENGVFKSSVCLHLIKRELTNNIEFYSGILHEDELYTPQLYFIARNVGYIPEKFFKRRIREDSIMTRKFSMANITGYSTVINELFQQKQNYPEFEPIIHKLIVKNANYLAYNANKMSFHTRVKTIKLLMKTHSFSNLRIKNLIILLFPYVFKIKSFIKRKL